MNSRTNEPKPLEKTIYVGTFVQCLDRHSLSIDENAMIPVNEYGQIVFIPVMPTDLNAIASECGWSSYRVVNASANQFFVPGFVGRLETSPQATCLT